MPRLKFRKLLSAAGRPLVMGILNVTPDSFSDGGRYADARRARERALEMVRQGADILDIGGESTRPGARAVSVADEIARVVPVIRGIARAVSVPVSVDTRKAEVAEAAIAAGAVIVNDVSGLRFDPKMADVAARGGAAVVIMHSRGTPADMQGKARYRDLVGEVLGELRASIRTAERAGIGRASIAVDPGIGFAKTAAQSIELIRSLGRMGRLGCAICIGVSRKSFIGRIADLRDPGSRLAGTIAANAAAIMNGADIIRVHDLPEAVQTVDIAGALRYSAR